MDLSYSFKVQQFQHASGVERWGVVKGQGLWTIEQRRRKDL